MKEEVLQYIWKHRLYKEPLVTTDGDSVEIINPGMHNQSAGPDFFNATVRIDRLTWVGNVELHVKSSDWMRHNHDADGRYDNVILHVVAEADEAILRKNGERIPTVVLRISDKASKIAQDIASSPADIKCSQYWKTEFISDIRLRFSALLFERMKRRADVLLQNIKNLNTTWDEMLYILICRTMGGNVNQQPFETLAQRVPLDIIGKKADEEYKIEALLYGAAGMLDDGDDDYVERLRLFYKSASATFDIKRMNGTEWRYSKMRPPSFPTIRISQISQLLFRRLRMFTHIIDCCDIEDIKKMFDVEVSDYWLTHYKFGKESKARNKEIGTEMQNALIINAVAPVVFAYGVQTNDNRKKEWAIEILETVPAEINNITKSWAELGIGVRDASESQALIELRKNYCDKSNCLRCPICHKIRSGRAHV